MAALSVSISYVPFHAFCLTGSAASAPHDVLCPDGTAPPFTGSAASAPHNVLRPKGAAPLFAGPN